MSTKLSLVWFLGLMFMFIIMQLCISKITNIWWHSDKDELRVKEETGATIRCFPFEQPEGRSKTCLMTGNPAEEVAIFAKSY